MFNPYAQGGWQNSRNPNATSSRNTIPQPSVYGAVPFVASGPTPMFVSFRFTSFSPSILNSTVMGPHGKTYFHVTTDVPTPGVTVISNSNNQPTAIVEWLRNPMVEVRGFVHKQQTSDWLALAQGKRYRTMTAKNKTFVWAPDDDSICLYSSGVGAPETYARLTREDGAVALEITSEAIQLGLLDVCVAAALLLQCGRKID
ncbi:hypothetical protein R3P38DRAFT_3318987 [Favolaschia claudopus]|uniref:Tubby C-terminal-like domain-containing protein n=1 Tax=Favolaschia claudopus TaxID=2862362 RepID=A0AAW0B3B7_9AGAR